MPLQISSELLELLNGKNLASKRHEAMMLQTVTEDGWPHGHDQRRRNHCPERNRYPPGSLERHHNNGKYRPHRPGDACHMLERQSPLCQAVPIRTARIKGAKHPRARFSGTVESTREDIVKYADIISGIQIELKDEEAVIKRWEETLEELRK